MSRATKQDLKEREDLILRYIAQGLRISDFEEELAKTYRCSASTIRKQANSILNDMKEQRKGVKDEVREVLLLQANLVYKKALEAGNTKGMLDAVNQIAKLNGLYDREADAKSKMPDIIEFEKKDFSQLAIVGDKVEGKE